MTEPATTCDWCEEPIPYGVTCYSVPTGATWQGVEGDLDNGKPVVEIMCAGCYDGPAVGRTPTLSVLQ